MYDILVLGGGIAGVSLANFASRNGKKVLLLDKGKIKDNASVAAGAFLSPKFGPKSNYNDLINRAFIYSLEFFKNGYSEFLNECGMLRLPRDKEEELTCEDYLKSSDFWEKKEMDGYSGYFCKNAATIDPYPTLLKMLKEVDFKEDIKEKSVTCRGDFWQIGEYKAKHLVLATGSKLLIKDEPYIKIKPIFGQKLEAKSKNGYNFHIHRRCSVSAKVGEKVLVGATHIPSWRFENKEELFKEHRDKLEAEANLLLKNDIEVLGYESGYRSSTTDYFPIAGKVIKSSQTLKNFPSIYHGVSIDEENFTYYNNLWIHTGHGARAFVLAPYTARELYYQMFEEERFSEKEITLSRQLIRYARKIKI